MRLKRTMLDRMLIRIAAALMLSAVQQACHLEAPVSRPPNIVILVADDLGWKDVGFHGSEFRTPHIDRIANEGAELSRFYAMPVCSPTRVALMTGHHPIRYGLQRATIKPWTDLGIPPDVETLPEMLARAGYTRRGVFGKWHLGRSMRFHPQQQGFTSFVGHYGGAIDYFRHSRLDGLDWHHGYSLSDEEGYSTDLIGRHAARFIMDAPRDEPFLLYVPFNAIHTPNDVTPEDMDRNSDIEPETRQIKAAMVSAMDDEVGRILDALDERGFASDTLLLFFSDNGGVPPAGSSNEPLRGRKHSLYEGGIRVAAAARWPGGGISGGRLVEAPISVLDLYPTFLRLAGLDVRRGLASDGEDVTAILDGRQEERNEFEYFGYFNGRRVPGSSEPSDRRRWELAAVFEGPWKLIRNGPNLDLATDPVADSNLELFRIEADPYETSDLASEHPDVVARLLKRIVEFRRLKPDDAMPIPLAAPEGWSAPADWRVVPDPAGQGSRSGTKENEPTTN